VAAGRSKGFSALQSLRFGTSGLGVRAQFRGLLFSAGNNYVLNWDLTPKPQFRTLLFHAGNIVVLNWDLTPKPGFASAFDDHTRLALKRYKR
jgi:hypothetical protein